MSENKTHLPLPDEPGYWWRQGVKSSGTSIVYIWKDRAQSFLMSCVFPNGTNRRVSEYKSGEHLWTKIPDPPEPELKLPRLFRWRNRVGVVFEVDCHATKNVIMTDGGHLQYHLESDWIERNVSEIEWIDDER